MRTALALLALLACAADARDRLSRAHYAHRSQDGTSDPAIWFAPPSGAGVPAGGPYTTAKGDLNLVCVRASVSSCPTPWDTEAAVVDLSNNECCVTRQGPDGYPALGRWGAYTQKGLRTSELDNAAWSDVGTPTVTPNAVASPSGTTTAETVEDDDAAGFEGRGQDISVTASAATTLTVYAKAGTATKIQLSIDGTTCDKTVTSTWARYSCQDASASGTTITISVSVGNAASDTGTVHLWRVNATETAWAVPGVDATSASVDVAATTVAIGTLDLTALNTAGCAAVSYNTPMLIQSGSADALVWLGASGRLIYKPNASNTVRYYDGTTEKSLNYTWAANTTKRFATRWSGTTATIHNLTDGTSASDAYDGAWQGASNPSNVGTGYNATLGGGAGWVWNLQVDTNPTRCQ